MATSSLFPHSTGPLHRRFEDTRIGGEEGDVNDEDTPRLDQLLQTQEELRAVLNPRAFEDKARTVFPPPKTDPLDGFHVHTAVYTTIWPAACTDSLKRAAALRDDKIHKDLEVFVVMAKSLYEAKAPKTIRVAVDFHGGGGFTGHPLFRPWRYRPWTEYMSRAGDLISLEPTYPLMPESSGTEVRQHTASLWTWMTTELDATVRSLNPNLTLDWSHFSISGGSFGGAMALELYREIATRAEKEKPHHLRIRGLHLRYPVSQHYTRDAAGEYMGVQVSKEQAEQSSREMAKATRDRGFVIPRAGSHPPEAMYGAYASSVSGSWPSLWREPSTFALLQRMESLPDHGTRVRIAHGAEDIHVPLRHSVTLASMLREKGLEVTCCWVEGKAHAYDYEDAHDDGLEAHWDAM